VNPGQSMKRKVLILGGTGMLGHLLFRLYSSRDDWDVYATVRSAADSPKWIDGKYGARVRAGVDALDIESVASAISAIQPDLLINCIALKESSAGGVRARLIAINALLPHRLAGICRQRSTRMIHISTDGVFDGKQGMSTEGDLVRISDVYGMTKFLGEVGEDPCLTLRTSIIGHEVRQRNGLVEWFLRQEGGVRGFTRAIYSGFPTVELARIISDYIVPDGKLSGLYHVSSEPISKYDLLRLIADQYGKKIEIEPWEDPVLDRSLDSSAFRSRTGYTPPSWPDMIRAMHRDYSESRGSLYV
jgi:dTDP-4-dehydrorhamnose reductase